MTTTASPLTYVRQAQVLGEAGQRALAAARLRAPEDETTRDYLERAGVTFVEDGAATEEAGAVASDLVREGALTDAARALLGAFAAVETIKASTGLGTRASFPRGLRLDHE